MNKTEYLLTCLIEECAEVQQAATKALRFGLNNKLLGGLITNAQSIGKECVDLIAIIEMIGEAGIVKKIDTISLIEQKKVRVLSYMQESRDL